MYSQQKRQMNYLKSNFLYKIKMLYYDRIDCSEGIDINKTSASKEYGICHYQYFLNKGFKFQPYVSNRCHDLLMIFMNLSDFALSKIKNANYCCISKSEAINLLQNIDLNEKSGTLQNIKIYYHM